MEKLKVSQVAQSLGVSNQTVYNYLSKFRQELDGNLIRENGKQYLTQDGFKILKTSLGKSDPVETVKSSQNLESLIIGLKETIDNLIRQHSEERQRSDTIIMKLTNDVGSLQKVLEYRQPEPPAPAREPVVKESTSPLKSRERETAAPIRALVVESSQREIGFIESVKLGLDDFCGLLFGRG